MIIFKYIIIVLIGYFIGNISWAKIISKYKLKSDITKSGSGNPGTMNMYRTYGAKIGALTLFLDVLKGVIPSLIGMLILGSEETSIFIDGHINQMAINGLFIGGTSAVVGHIFPVIYKFKGGKGVATTLGVFWAANPLIMSIAFIFMLAFLLIFEYGGVGSIITVAGVVSCEAYLYQGNYIVLSCLVIIFFLVWFAHRKNILRTLTGEENKTDLRKLFKKKIKKTENLPQNENK